MAAGRCLWSQLILALVILVGARYRYGPGPNGRHQGRYEFREDHEGWERHERLPERT